MEHNTKYGRAVPTTLRHQTLERKDKGTSTVGHNLYRWLYKPLLLAVFWPYFGGILVVPFLAPFLFLRFVLSLLSKCGGRFYDTLWINSDLNSP